MVGVLGHGSVDTFWEIIWATDYFFSYKIPLFSSFSSVQFSRSVVSDSLRPHESQHTRSVHRVGDAIQPSHPLSSPSPPALNLSQHQGLFKWVGLSHQVARVLSFSFSISPSNEYSRLISFRMDWLDLLAVQETLKSLLQHHSSKASILWCSAFLIVQLSHPYMTTGKNHSLD